MRKDISQMQTKRKSELSLLNLFFCALVALIHILSESVTALDKTSLAYLSVVIPWRLSSFVVQGFIFLSGLKFVLSAKQPFSFVSFWKKKVSGIILPYILWVFIYYCYFVYNHYFPFRLSDLAQYILNGTLVSPFYFVIIILQFYLLAPLLLKLTNKTNRWVLLAVSLVGMLFIWKNTVPFLNATGLWPNFPYTDRIFTSYFFYFIFGMVVGKAYQKCLTFLARFTPLFFGIWCILAVGDMILYLKLQTIVGWTFIDIYHVFYCIASILFCVSFAAKCSGIKLPTLVALADKATYHVYLCHCLFIFIGNDIMARLGIGDIGLRTLLRFCFVYTASFTLCMGWQKLKIHLKPKK